MRRVEPHRGHAALDRKSRWKASRAEALSRSVFTRKGSRSLSRSPATENPTTNMSRMLTCATSRTCRSRTISTPTSSARCAPMYPTPGWTAARTRSATRSTSTATSYKSTPPRPLEVIDAELKQAEEEIMRLLREGDGMTTRHQSRILALNRSLSGLFQRNGAHSPLNILKCSR